MISSILTYLLVFVYTMTYFIIFSAVFALTWFWDRKRIVMHVMSRWWTVGYFWLVPGWKITVQGREKIDPKQAYVIIVNHNSMMDIPLMYVIPMNFKWVAKKEVYNWPLFGWVMRMHRDITIERGTAKAVRKMIRDGGKWLHNGVSVMIFPEGSRSRDGEVHRFREGAFLMAKEAGMPILPCVAEGTARVTRGWKLNFGVKFTVRILDPVSAQEVAASEPSVIASRLHGEISREYENIRKQL